MGGALRACLDLLTEARNHSGFFALAGKCVYAGQLRKRHQMLFRNPISLPGQQGCGAKADNPGRRPISTTFVRISTGDRFMICRETCVERSSRRRNQAGRDRTSVKRFLRRRNGFSRKWYDAVAQRIVRPSATTATIMNRTARIGVERAL
jgi:hypothetical protein